MTTDQANKYIRENTKKVNNEFRLTYHAMPEIGWMNDPNGLVYYQGNYHLFYQHNPYNSTWGPMHWGHIISKDLMTFKYLPIALSPDQKDESGCFSGGAIVDKLDPDILHLFYTKHLDNNGTIIQTQGLASTIDGINFQKRDKPVIDINLEKDYAQITDIRDPKPILLNDDYYILLGSKDYDDLGKLLIYKSNDLHDFEYHGSLKNQNFGHILECPDYIQIDNKDILIYSVVEPHTSNKSNTSQYMLGNLDIINNNYQINTINKIDSGHHFYAPQTLKDNQNRIIMIAWMEIWGDKLVTNDLGHNWQGAMTIPRVLTIKDNTLYQEPISEIKNYYTNELKLTNNINISKQSDIFINEINKDFNLKISNLDKTEYFELSYSNKTFSVNGLNLNIHKLDKLSSKYKYDKIKLRILLDTSSIEIFINDGIETFTSRIYMHTDKYTLLFNEDLQGKIFTITKELNYE